MRNQFLQTRSLRTQLRRLDRTQTRCLVCGFSEVLTDEVFDRALVLLHECPHCEYRWTRAAPASAATKISVPHVSEVPAAA